MSEFIIKKTSKDSAEIKEDFIIDENQTTRKVFRAVLINNKNDKDACVSGWIIHQRKSKTKEWKDITNFKLNELKAGEGVKLKLSTGQLKRFYEILQQAYAMGNEGVLPDNGEIIVGKPSEVIEIDKKRKAYIQELLNQNHGNEVWEELISSDPDLATKLAYSRIQTNRILALKEFEKCLDEDKSESYWQTFFEKNDWIFGYGLNYQFLHQITSQPNYGGTNIHGKGSQRGDFLMKTSSKIKFTVLVEIKKPTQSLFHKARESKIENYRNGTPSIHRHIVSAISQLQVNADTFELEGSKTQSNYEEFSKADIYTHKPKGILIVGHSNQLEDIEKRKAFEIFRQSINNPEILFFDELYERAKFIVAQPQVGILIPTSIDEI